MFTSTLCLFVVNVWIDLTAHYLLCKTTEKSLFYAYLLLTPFVNWFNYPLGWLTQICVIKAHHDESSFTLFERVDKNNGIPSHRKSPINNLHLLLATTGKFQLKRQSKNSGNTQIRCMDASVFAPSTKKSFIQDIRMCWCIIYMFVCSPTSCLCVVNVDIDQNHQLWRVSAWQHHQWGRSVPTESRPEGGG